MESDKAFHRLVDLLSRRDHSVCELRQKLGRRFSAEAIDEALQRADSYGYLTNPTALANRLAEQLSRRGKGQLAIAHALQAKGLPPIERTDDQELAAALAVCERKGWAMNKFDFAQREKAYRFLRGRGFTSATIRELWRQSPDAED